MLCILLVLVLTPFWNLIVSESYQSHDARLVENGKETKAGEEQFVVAQVVLNKTFYSYMVNW